MKTDTHWQNLMRIGQEDTYGVIEQEKGLMNDEGFDEI